MDEQERLRLRVLEARDDFARIEYVVYPGYGISSKPILSDDYRSCVGVALLGSAVNAPPTSALLMSLESHRETISVSA